MIHGELADVNSSVVVIDPTRELIYFGCPGTQAETETGDELVLGTAEYGPDGVIVNDWDNPAFWGMGDDLLGAIASGYLMEFPDDVDLRRCHIFPTDDPPSDSRELAEMPEMREWLDIAGRQEAWAEARDGLDLPRIVVTPEGDGSCLPALMAHVGFDDVREMDPDATEDDIRVLELAARTFRPADAASTDAVLCAACGGHRWIGEDAPVIVRARALASALVGLKDAQPCFKRFWGSPDLQLAPWTQGVFRVHGNHIYGRCGRMSVEDAAMARGACDDRDVVRACIEASPAAMVEVSCVAEGIVGETLAWYDATVDGGDVLGSIENDIIAGDGLKDYLDRTFISRDIGEAVALIENSVTETGRLPEAGDLPYQVEEAIEGTGLAARDGHLVPADLKEAALAETVEEAWPWEDAYVEYTSANPPCEVQDALWGEVVERVRAAAMTEARERAVASFVGWRDSTTAPDAILAPKTWRAAPSPVQLADAASLASKAVGGSAAQKTVHGQRA